MSETEWTENDVAAETAKKKGIPWWVWGCGGGCLLFVLVTAGAVAVLGPKLAQWAEDMSDPEVQWPKVAEYLPYDERPEHIEMVMGLDIPGQKQWTMMDNENGLLGQLFVMDKTAGGDMMRPGSAANAIGVSGEESGLMVVQGVEVDAMFFKMTVPLQGEAVGPAVRVDLSGSSKNAVILQVTVPDGEGTVSEEDVELFLAPFDVWRNR